MLKRSVYVLCIFALFNLSCFFNCFNVCCRKRRKLVNMECLVHSLDKHDNLCNCVSEIGAVVKVVDSHLWGWSSIPNKSCSFLIVSFSEDLSLCFMGSDQHVKYRMPCGFPSTSSLLLDYHVKQYIHTYTHTYILIA